MKSPTRATRYSGRYLGATCTIPPPHPMAGTYTLTEAKQDGRHYYRIAPADGSHLGYITGEFHAGQTIEYWRTNGWLTQGGRR
jgi:hypothetical protein